MIRASTRSAIDGRPRGLLSVLAAAAALLAACPAWSAAEARYPGRVITLLPSFTETVCALGACDRLVATDRYSNWPAEVKALPKAGGLEDADIELIVSLKPDLVVLSRSQRITERLREL